MESVTDCVFCLENWPNLDIVETRFTAAIINPLNPVTPGHVLVIGARHTENAGQNPSYNSWMFQIAADYVARMGIQANIITSIGPDATQTVFHTHVHVVPRTEGDGLPLPWSIQCKECHGQPLVARGLCATCYKRWQRLPDRSAPERGVEALQDEIANIDAQLASRGIDEARQDEIMKAYAANPVGVLANALIEEMNK